LPKVGARRLGVVQCFEAPLLSVSDIFNRFRKKIVRYKENLMEEISQRRGL